jgi:thymidylate synthase (FAD)
MVIMVIIGSSQKYGRNLLSSNVRYYNIKKHLVYIIMSVKLTSFSKPVDDSQSLQDLVAYCARVSNPANQNNTQTNEKLIRYLIKNNHWSPLEMVSVCLEIETTRDIARQILRHRSFSFQEFSQRYAVADLGFECKEARLQDKKNRQNSIQTDNADLQNEWEAQQKRVADNAQTAYKWALDNGIAKEQARAVLPEGMTLSRMYMNGTLRSWVHYISLRSGNGTQKEHRDVAIACAKAIEPIFPMINEFIAQCE